MADETQGRDGAGTPARITLAQTAPREAWERLWVAALRSQWRTLAVLPAGPGLPSHTVAAGLAQVGGEYRGRPVELVDARGLQLAHGRALLERLSATTEPYALVLALDCPAESRSALLVARAAEAALLLVALGSTSFSSARQVLEEVGRAAFLGAVTLPET